MLKHNVSPNNGGSLTHFSLKRIHRQPGPTLKNICLIDDSWAPTALDGVSLLGQRSGIGSANNQPKRLIPFHSELETLFWGMRCLKTHTPNQPVRLIVKTCYRLLRKWKIGQLSNLILVLIVAKDQISRFKKKFKSFFFFLENLKNTRKIN